MSDARDPAHYLKALVSDNTPKRLLWLDCASQSEREQGAWVERWERGALGTTHYTSRKGERVDTLNVYRLPADLWVVADRFCLPRRRTVLFAYDLALQLRISKALIGLPMFDWHLEKIVLERSAAWALFRDGDRTLLMCDLKSWAPVALDTLHTDIGVTGYKSYTQDAALSHQDLRCLVNAETVRESVLQILAWVDAEGLGPFRPTGSGQSYSAFRRRFLTTQLLVHDDVARLQAERAAMHTGRCEAWQHGELREGPFIEYDLHAAYATIVRDCHVPALAKGTYKNVTTDDAQLIMSQRAVLAHVTIETEVPCVPTKLGGRTTWPVGTFQTWIWDPELQLALDHAKNVTIHTLYAYTREPALQDFAAFVLNGMADSDPKYGQVPKRVLKHWSRCLVGRLGLRYRSWQKFGTQDEPDLRLVTYIDTEEGVTTDMLIAGYDRLLLSDMSEAVDSLPQIPSWVMSECRRRLWEAMTGCGLHTVVYVDTDSIIVSPHHDDPLNTQWSLDDEPEWVRKGSYSRLTIHGPRNIVAEHQRRVAGLPLTARQTAPLEFSGQVMRSIKESMRAGQLDCVANMPRHFVLDSPDMRRQHLPDHKTAPFTVQLPNGGSDDECPCKRCGGCYVRPDRQADSFLRLGRTG